MTSVLPTLTHTFDHALGASLTALASKLTQAQQAASEAAVAMDNGDQPLAMGTLMPLERILPECQMVLTAIFALRRWSVAARKSNGGAA